MRKLRIAHLVIQPVLVWDDGEELESGPEVGQVTLPLSKLAGFAESLPGEVAGLQARLEMEATEPQGSPEQPQQ